LAHSASLEHTGKPETHPIITLNALKNILSENPSKPSKNKSQDLLRDLKVDGVSGSVFFMDLEDALQRGDNDQALKEAARLYTVSDNPICVLECVAELALQSIQELGQFIFHLMRAAVFNPTHDNTWLFICCAIEEITKNNLPDPHDSEPIIIESFIPYILRQSNQKLLIDFSVMKRLWDREYLRSRVFIREISYWLSTLKLNDSEIDHSKTKFTATSDSDEDLTKKDFNDRCIEIFCKK
jgi:Ca2+-binding EF-hand superfamily protein